MLVHDTTQQMTNDIFFRFIDRELIATRNAMIIHLRNRIVAIWKPERQVRNFTKLQILVTSNNEDHAPWSLYYCLFGPHAVYKKVILRAHPVRGESHIQRNVNRKVATPSRGIKTKLRLECTYAIISKANNWFKHEAMVWASVLWQGNRCCDNIIGIVTRKTKGNAKPQQWQSENNDFWRTTAKGLQSRNLIAQAVGWLWSIQHLEACRNLDFCTCIALLHYLADQVAKPLWICGIQTNWPCPQSKWICIDITFCRFTQAIVPAFTILYNFEHRVACFSKLD